MCCGELYLEQSIGFDYTFSGAWTITSFNDCGYMTDSASGHYSVATLLTKYENIFKISEDCLHPFNLK